MRFFLIDKIKEWHIGKTAKAVKNIALSEDFFDDHFPRRPVMPGVLMIEGMAQLSGLLLEASLKEKYREDAKAILTVLERTKFRDLVKPGDTLIYTTEILSLNKNGGKVSASAFLNEKAVVTTGMVYAFKYINDSMLESKRQALMKLWMS